MTSRHSRRGLDLPQEIAIDRHAEVPIGVQLAWALRARIYDGRYKAGQRLPGLRELAVATGVNVNTVKAVYQRLDSEGLIDSQQGSGTFVGPTPQRPPEVSAIVANAVREAAESGVDPREVAAALYVSREPPQIMDTDAERRRVLRGQIASLERALGEMAADYPWVASTPVEPRRSSGPRLLGLQELEGVRAQLVRRMATLQAAIDEQELADSPPPPARRRQAKNTSRSKPKRSTKRPRATPRAAPASG